MCEIDKKQLRRQYYSQMTWQDFKEFLKEENRLAKVEKTKFDHYLRKDVNLNSKRYNYFPQKVGEGKIIESPAGKVLKINKISKP